MAAKIIMDELFGRIRYDVLWTGKVVDPRLQAKPKLSISVEKDGDTPSDAQRAVYRAFRERETQILSDVQSFLFEYYQSNRDEIACELPASRVTKKLQALRNESQIWRVVESTELYLPIQNKKRQTLQLTFAVTWDDEHALSVAIIDGKLLKKVMDAGEGF